MPELPEVEALVRFLAEKGCGQVIERVEVAALSALKTYDPPVEALKGRTIDTATRRGKYLGIQAGDLWLVMHLARGGWVQWRDTTPAARARPGKGPLALRVGLSGNGGFDVTEQGTEKRLALWVVRELTDVEGLARLGPDPLDPEFGEQELAALLHGRPGNLKTVLTDQSVLAGVGNAYSDEALHAARLSPFKPAGKLDAAEVAALHAALVGVLHGAVERSMGLPANGLKAEKRSGLSVHSRTGLPCPVCGDTIREVSFATKSLQYCPNCQTGGRLLADPETLPVAQVSEDPRAKQSAKVIEDTTHRGIRWQRVDRRVLRFYDPDGDRWVTWRPGADAPPLPPGWGPRRRLGGVERPSWRSRWRLVPLALIALVLVIAVVQALRPSANQVHKEAAATAALLGKCLAQDGTAEGYPKYSAKPVPCSSPHAAVRVANVITSTPGSPLCSGGATGVELPYAGVRYPHILCIQPVQH